jgi:ubiquinol-cytochrome c reductase iron-sulfur subunit
VAVIGLVVIIGLSAAFFIPSEKGKDFQFLDIDISGLKTGKLAKYKFNGKPVWVLRRSPQMIEHLQALDPKFLKKQNYVKYSGFPELEKKALRSLADEYFVFEAKAPWSECEVAYVSPYQQVEISPSLWQGGFHDRCTGHYFDAAGRLYNRTAYREPLVSPVVTGPYLRLPPYRMDGDTIIIGMSDQADGMEK